MQHRSRLIGIILFLVLVLTLATPALAAPATIVDNTAGSATNDGTVNPGEYVGYTTGINSGFGNVIGSGSQLHIDSASGGNLHIGLITGGGSFNDAMVIYVDSVSGGYASTSTFDDTGDPCRKAISGYDGFNRSILNFAPGFAADYAICMDTTFAGVWQLAGTGSHTYIASASRTTTTPGHFEMNLTMANLGLAAGGTFKYVATYLNPSNAYRSDEFHGVAAYSGGNPGYTTVNLASGDYNVFTSYATVVVSAGGSSAGYGTLKGAFDAINAGTHTGAIDVKINGNTTETAPAVLNASGSGSASYTAVTIGPGNASVAVSGNVIGALVDLNGADNVTVDGRVGGVGTSKDLTFENTNNSSISGSQGVTLRFRNDATNNVVRYVVLRGAAAGPGSSDGVVSFGDPASGGSGNSNITVEYCDIRESSAGTPINGIAAGVTSGAQNSAITIQYNNIFNFFQPGTDHNGIRISSGAGTGWTIKGNSFYKTVTNTSTAGNSASAIFISNTSGNGFVITDNVIGGQAPNAGGGPWTVYFGTTRYATRFLGIRLAVGTTTASSVQGNVITNFDWQTSSGATTSGGIWSGIYVSSGAVDIGTATANTVGSGSAADAVKVTSSTGGAQMAGIWSDSASTVTIANNTVGGISGLGTSASIGAVVNGIKTTGSGGNVTVNNNTVGSAATADSLRSGTAGTTTGACSVNGIDNAATGTIAITNNLVANLTVYTSSSSGQARGIANSAGAATITGNTVRNVSSSSTNTGTGSSAVVIGISQTSTTAGVTLAQNTVHSLANTAASAAVSIVGINYNGPTSGVNSVARNLVHSLKLATSSTSASINGIFFGGGTGLTVANNMVRLGLDETGASLTTGYAINGINFSNGTANLYYNTAYVGGAGVASSANTAAFNSGVTFNTRIYKNNIWVNARSNASGTATNAAAFIAGTIGGGGLITGLTNDYNLYHAPGTGGALIRNGTTNYTLSSWRTATSNNYDVNSVSGDPLLVNPTGSAGTVDLHVDTSGSISPAANAGTPVADVTGDYDAEARNSTYPDIGADEFTDSGPLPAGTYGTRAVNSGETWTLAGNVTLSGGLGLNGGLLDVGTSTLLFGPGAAVFGTPSASSMIIADGGGQVCKEYAAADPGDPPAFTFPIGDNTGTPEYSPATLDFTTGTFASGAQACVNVTDAQHPAMNVHTHYLTRYWTVTQTGISAFNCQVTFNYLDADINTVESALTGAKWNTGDTYWTPIAPVDETNNQFGGNVSSFSDFSAGSMGPNALTLSQLDATAVSLAWPWLVALAALGLAVALLLRRRAAA
ncbi:MAG: hypothetical protein NZ528_10155 [Caldilineales bacterium]|nr:hypothetical protein [Caldilineales bacterium]